MLEQRPAEIVHEEEILAIDSQKKTYLVFGSPEMQLVRERMAYERTLLLGAAASQLSIEITPVTNGLEA